MIPLSHPFSGNKGERKDANDDPRQTDDHIAVDVLAPRLLREALQPAVDGDLTLVGCAVYHQDGVVREKGGTGF